VGLLAKESKMAANDLLDRESRLQSYLEELQHQAKRMKQLETRLQAAQEQAEEEKEGHERAVGESVARGQQLEEEIDKLNQELFAQSQQILSLERGAEEWEGAVEEREQMVRDLESQLIQLNEASQQFQMEKLELA
jgi:chromosome segregation ATPase